LGEKEEREGKQRERKKGEQKRGRRGREEWKGGDETVNH